MQNKINYVIITLKDNKPLIFTFDNATTAHSFAQTIKLSKETLGIVVVNDNGFIYEIIDNSLEGECKIS